MAPDGLVGRLSLAAWLAAGAGGLALAAALWGARRWLRARRLGAGQRRRSSRRPPPGGGRDGRLQRALEQELERESRFANAVINSLPGMFYLLDCEGRCHRWNRNLETVTGYSGEEIAAMRPIDYFAEADREPIEEAVAEAFACGEVTIEADLVTKAGRVIPHLWTGFRVELDGEAYMAGVGIDISERRALEAELTRQATTDPLTAIPNRLHFEHHLEREIAQSERHDRPLSLIMVDLDHFKEVNDRNGHEVGDTVLQQAVAVVRPLLRGGDLVARWGGEEFMVLAAETDRAGATDLAERLRAALEAHPFPGDGGGLTASFGVAQYAPGETQGALLRRVDAALYRAKQGGRNRVVVAGPEVA
jgi:diguanylate cyclase (GGDEF)-like protein/PAS domain S-box-containing protein